MTTVTTVTFTNPAPATSTSAVARLLAVLGLLPSGSGPTWLVQARRESLEWATAHGLPTRKDEDWKYTRLDALLDVPFERAEAGVSHRAASATLEALTVNPSSTRVVFVNGYFVPDLSSLSNLKGGVTVTSLAAALARGATGLEPVFSRAFDQYDHAFTALNTALAGDGAYIQIAADTVVDTPIELVFLSDVQGTPLLSSPRSVILAGPRSRASVIETHAGIAGGVTWTNAVVHVILDEGARVDHFKIQDEPDTGFHLALLSVNQGPGSQFFSSSMMLGSKIARNEVHVHLEGEGSQVSIDGLYWPRGDQHHDNVVLIEHVAPRCVSHQLYKGIVDGHGHGVFNGRIIVWPGADGTDANQTNKNLLLSEYAEIDTRPRLEIFTDDVKCTHGAAVGALDEEALFYLRSRGVPREAARALLTHAFAREMLDRVASESLRTHVETLLAERLSADGFAIEGTFQ
jgi:Fe-S cluster assembly protein SufD